MKLQEYLEKYTELSEEQKDDLTKLVQGETDAVRTDYSAKLKDLEQYKPKEKTETEKQLEEAQQELAQYKFAETCKSKGLSADLAKYLRSDADLDAFTKVYQSQQSSENNFVPNKVNTTGTEMSKDDFKSLSYGEKAKIYAESPELFEELSK